MGTTASEAVGNPSAPADESALERARALRAKGMLNIKPKLAAEILGTSELQLRRFRKQHPDQLVAIPQGKRAIAYRLTDIERMATTGWRID